MARSTNPASVNHLSVTGTRWPISSHHGSAQAAQLKRYCKLSDRQQGRLYVFARGGRAEFAL
jgi:hypothetical protein